TVHDGIGSLRIAIAGDYFTRGGEPECFAAMATVAKALGTTKTVVLPNAAAARAAAYVITAVEGALLPASWYVKAQRFRRQYWTEVVKLFNDVDILLAPATPCSAPRIGQAMMTIGGVELPVRANLGLFTPPISFIGL